MEKKKIKQIVVLEKNNSIFSYITPVILIFGLLYYGLVAQKMNIFLNLVLVLGVGLYIYLNVLNAKIVVTNNKFYYYVNGRRVYESHYINDFNYINYEQSRLGKIFNYGTLILINQEKRLFSIHYVSDIFKTYETIINSYEDYRIVKNPNYVRQYVKKESNVDTIVDLIDDENEKEQ